MIVSPYNRLEDGRYFDIEGKSSWEFDHVTQVFDDIDGDGVGDCGTDGLWQKASNVQSYVSDSEHEDTMYVFNPFWP